MKILLILIVFTLSSCSLVPAPECYNSRALKSVRDFYKKKHNVQITTFRNIKTLTRDRRANACGCVADITTAASNKLKKVEYSVQIPGLNEQSVVFDYVIAPEN
jgi:hypothetical protein